MFAINMNAYINFNLVLIDLNNKIVCCRQQTFVKLHACMGYIDSKIWWFQVIIFTLLIWQAPYALLLITLFALSANCLESANVDFQMIFHGEISFGDAMGAQLDCLVRYESFTGRKRYVLVSGLWLHPFLG